MSGNYDISYADRCADVIESVRFFLDQHGQDSSDTLKEVLVGAVTLLEVEQDNAVERAAWGAHS